MKGKYLFIIRLILFLLPFVLYGNIETLKLRKKGDLASRNSKYLYALSLYKEAYKIAIREKDFNEVAEICIDEASVSFALNDYKSFFAKCEEAKRNYDKTSNKNLSTLFKIYSTFAVYYRNTDNIQKTIEFYALSNEILYKHKEVITQIPNYVAFHYSNQGVFKYSLGDFDEAQNFYLRALEIQRKLETKSDLAIIEANLASQLLLLNRFVEAKKLLENVATFYIYSKKIYDFNSIEILKNLSICQSKTGEYATSIKNLKLAIGIYQKLITRRFNEKINVETSLYNELAAIYETKRQLNEAQKMYQLSISTFEKKQIKTSSQLSEAYLGLGRISEKNNSFKEAITFINQSIQATNSPDKGAYFEIMAYNALKQRALLYKNIGISKKDLTYLDKAKSDFNEVIRLAINLKKNYESPSSKFFFVERVYPVFEEAISVLWEINRLKRNCNDEYNEAFVLIEQVKSLIAKDIVDTKLKEFGNIPEKDVSRIHSFRQWISQLKNSISAETDLQKINSIKKDIDKYEFKFDSLLRSYQSTYPLISNYLCFIKKPNLNEFQKQLDNETAYLSFFKTKTDYYAFIVTNDKSSFQKLATSTTLIESKVNAFIHLIETKPTSLDTYKGMSQSKEINDILIKPFQSFLKNKSRLIINPDGNLHALSFDLLQNADEQMLIRDFAISYSHSLPNLIKNQPLEKVNWLCFAPYHTYTNTDSEQKLMTDSSILGSKKDLGFVNGSTYIDRQADKQSFIFKIKNNEQPILLFTHASADANNPLILFRHGNDRELKLKEVSSMIINSPLVVLSACETAKGQVYRGEGQISMSKAFTYAGCHSVISSLWLANNTSTTILTEKLHNYLNEGYPKDVALQKAKLEYLDEGFGRTNDLPFYWGHFQLYGDREPIFEEKQIFRYIFILLTLFALLGFYVKSRFK